MNKDLLTHNIEKLLIALHRQIVDIRDSEHRVPKMEMDQALANVRALYEQFTVLNYLNTFGEPEAKENSVSSPSAVSAPSSEKLQKEEQVAAEAAPEPEKVAEPFKPEPVVISEVARHQPVPEPDVIPALEAKQESGKENMAIALGEMKELTLADKLRTQKLDDLNKAVNMADKFLFMNDLFKGENSAYKEALEVLNKLSDHAEAERYMAALGIQYGWEENSKTEKKFRELVARKFS